MNSWGDPNMLTVLSLGAGVQSSTLALMATHGEVWPLPDCAIFADTGWEPKAVYEWLSWLKTKLSFPVHTVGDANLREQQITARMRGLKVDGVRWSSLPYFTMADGGTESGMVNRQCTKDYKIVPIERFIKRELLHLEPRQRMPKTPVVEQWRGISADEAQRMKPSTEKWMTVRYPLAMEKRMTRGDCLAWMMRHGYPVPPRSACIGCPFHSDHEWRTMRDQRPEEWRDAVEFDKAVREAGGMRGKTYLHRSCKPLDEVQFVEDAYAGNFGNDCGGHCGL
jgi:hypothetical protein